MSFWTADSIRAACAGSWLARPSSLSATLNGLSTDSRSVHAGQVFLALKGEKFDGHDYLREAAAAGANLLIIHDGSRLPSEGFGRPVGVLRVPDTAKALLRLAAAYRRTLETTRVVAVGGSNGKTTTTRLIDQLLSARYRGTASRKSFNNAVGVPLTILSASPSDQYLVCEIGTNHPGEIATLAKVIEPDVAVITSIGREHLEGFGSLEGVAREEGSLLGYLRPGGIAVVTADAPELAEHLKTAANVVTFGRSDSADLRLTHVEHALGAIGSEGRDGVRFTVNDRTTLGVPLLGEHNALNALAAVAVARRFGIVDEMIAEALARATGPEMRLVRERVGGIEVLNDAYNANPDSTLAALRTLSSLNPAGEGKWGRRIAVLGDMLELGDAAPDAHREIAQAILDLGNIDFAVIVGHLGLFTAERLARSWGEERYALLSDLDGDGAARVASMLRGGDLVLLKGSRRMRLERVLGALRERAAGTTPGADSVDLVPSRPLARA